MCGSIADKVPRRAALQMRGVLTRRIAAAAVAVAITAAPAAAQKSGGILRMSAAASPASLSIHEESTAFGQGPMMGVFNNLAVFDQQAKQSTLQTIVPDLASEWSWQDAGTRLTFKLRQGVRWHDGAPFTAKDVVCTYDLLLEKSADRLRANPRKHSLKNLDRVTADGDFQVSFHLKRPQPAFMMLLANGFAPIYPCHVPAARMRQHPIGTGPFKFVEFKPNEVIRVARNPDYWKPGLPYLDGIEYTVIRNPATAVLAFVSGKVDMTFPHQLTVPLFRDVRSQVPQAICEQTPFGGVNRHLLINRDRAPFNNPDLRRALTLSIDRQAFIDIIADGEGEIGGVMQPPPGGAWGMPREQLAKLPGYDPDVAKSREEARRIMRRLGYGPDNRLGARITTRETPLYRDPAVLLIDQLKEVYIDGELDVVETSNYFQKIRRQDFVLSLNAQTGGPDPGPTLELFYGCGSPLNWDGYCNREIDQLIEQQSLEADPDRRKQLVWEIERRLAEDATRPIIFYSSSGTCWQAYVKNVNLMVDSVFNANRREDWWLDK
jgi:peptide/nickel transport system substrate-binding protein